MAAPRILISNHAFNQYRKIVPEAQEVKADEIERRVNEAERLQEKTPRNFRMTFFEGFNYRSDGRVVFVLKSVSVDVLVLVTVKEIVVNQRDLIADGQLLDRAFNEPTPKGFRREKGRSKIELRKQREQNRQRRHDFCEGDEA
jgi:hypothetical protein